MFSNCECECDYIGYMPQKCQKWQICGYQVCMFFQALAKYPKTCFQRWGRLQRSPRLPIVGWGRDILSPYPCPSTHLASRSRRPRLGCQPFPQHKFLATPMVSGCDAQRMLIVERQSVTDFSMVVIASVLPIRQTPSIHDAEQTTQQPDPPGYLVYLVFTSLLMPGCIKAWLLLSGLLKSRIGLNDHFPQYATPATQLCGLAYCKV